MEKVIDSNRGKRTHEVRVRELATNKSKSFSIQSKLEVEKLTNKIKKRLEQ